MNSALDSPLLALQPFALDPDAVYSIDEAAHLTRLPRHFVLVCCKHGLLSPRVDQAYGAYYFGDSDIRTLQRIAYLHVDCGVNLTGIRIILGLMDEVQRLRDQQAAETYS